MKIVEESYRLVMKDNNFTQFFLGILLITISLLLFFGFSTKTFVFKDLLVLYILVLIFFFSGILSIISRKIVLITADKSKGLLTLSSKSLFSRDEESFPFSEIDSIVVEYYYQYGSKGGRSLRYNSMFILKNGRRIFFDEGSRGGILGALSFKRGEFETAKKLASFIGVEAKEQWPINSLQGAIDIGKEILNKISDSKGNKDRTSYL